MNRDFVYSNAASTDLASRFARMQEIQRPLFPETQPVPQAADLQSAGHTR